MKIKDIIDNYYFETLNETHDLSYFDCGDEELNDFLKNDALKQQNEKLNITKLIMFDGKIIGYTSILTDSLILKNINDEKLRLKIKGKLGIKSKNRNVPAVKIGRLAIEKKYSGEGLGTHILRNIIHSLKAIAKTNVSFRFIVVEGYAKAFNFYVAKNGFEYLKKDYEKVKNIDFISQRDPTKKFYLYLDLEKI
ncbi:MAG: GNAT family N-acetyltransferase [Methanobrevibacter sp.]|uniref:GNAT family N-acetyltransferase n=1 Tax=Methanobrevibacter sp. TaxID=66852 RepID=UPI0025EED6DA|nr:GNAT family N-acetyltransferase [Methanobrevibacter sp.]MBQ6100123.1 GNAT family N-acetyltransferase [Methanobrevibacter sp.]